MENANEHKDREMRPRWERAPEILMMVGAVEFLASMVVGMYHEPLGIWMYWEGALIVFLGALWDEYDWFPN